MFRFFFSFVCFSRYSTVCMSRSGVCVWYHCLYLWRSLIIHIFIPQSVITMWWIEKNWSKLTKCEIRRCRHRCGIWMQKMSEWKNMFFFLLNFLNRLGMFFFLFFLLLSWLICDCHNSCKNLSICCFTFNFDAIYSHNWFAVVACDILPFLSVICVCLWLLSQCSRARTNRIKGLSVFGRMVW